MTFKQYLSNHAATIGGLILGLIATGILYTDPEVIGNTIGFALIVIIGLYVDYAHI